MRNKTSCVLTLLAACALSPAAAQDAPRSAIDKALWEADVGGGEFYLPDYPAAGQKHAKWITAPYVIYRGKIFRADREGARARLLHGRRVDLEMSFSAAFATRSRDNDARQGMPDLDYLLEIGPRVSVRLSDLGGRGSLRLYLPARAVFSSDLTNMHHRGFTYAPALYGQIEPFVRPGWIGIVQLAARFGDRQISGYFYDVAPEFARPDRPAYDARGGYMGSDLSAGVAIPIGLRWRVFAGAQFFYDGSAANHASPLFKRDADFSTGMGLSYVFFRSRAPGRD